MKTTTTTAAAAETCSADCQSAVSPIANRPDLTDKIARLPKVTRDMLNVMLDDSLPYHVILDELGETAQGLSAGGLATWVKGSYQDYLKERQTIEDVATGFGGGRGWGGGVHNWMMDWSVVLGSLWVSIGGVYVC